MPQYTCEWSATIVTYDDHADIKPYCCKCWTCDACQHLRLRQLYCLIKSGDPTTWITLTSRVTPDNTPDVAAQQLVRAWRLIKRRAKTAGIAEHIPFIAIFEETKQGWPHLHIVCRAPYIPQRWLSRCMDELTNSPIVDIRKIHKKKKLANYLAKYLSKAPERYQGCKRYWRSKDWTLKKPDTPLFDKSRYRHTFISNYSVQYALEDFNRAGWYTASNDDGTYTAWPTDQSTNPFQGYEHTEPQTMKRQPGQPQAPPIRADQWLEEISIPGWDE